MFFYFTYVCVSALIVSLFPAASTRAYSCLLAALCPLRVVGKVPTRHAAAVVQRGAYKPFPLLRKISIQHRYFFYAPTVLIAHEILTFPLTRVLSLLSSVTGGNQELLYQRLGGKIHTDTIGGR